MKFSLVPVAERLPQGLLLSCGTHRTSFCPQHPRFGVLCQGDKEIITSCSFSHIQSSTRHWCDYSPLTVQKKRPCTYRVWAEESGIPEPAEAVDDGTWIGGAAVSHQGLGTEEQLGLGVRSPPQPSTPKLLSASSWLQLCLNHWKRTRTMGLGGKQKKQKPGRRRERNVKLARWEPRWIYLILPPQPAEACSVKKIFSEIICICFQT